MQTAYLVESYSPGLTAEKLEAANARVCAEAAAMTREGKAVRVLRSTIVPADEAWLCVFDAASEALVCEAYRRAGVPFERISLALSTAPGKESS